MPLHLIKLCVGADTPDDLRAWRASPEGRARANRELFSGKDSAIAGA